MATELGKAYVQILPSAKGIKGAITKELNGESASAGKSAGEAIGGNLIGVVKKLIVAAGIGKIISDSLNAGGALQQSFGGIETLYGEAADAAKAYAKEAASAGISANDYAEQAVSFGASLKAAFGGDMVAAAEAANTAILDMADNSAKMGTDITAIQTAYQGFAKQNYTMLDNLKLGYGGTKTEMERLLKDATKLSGIEYNIDNLGDVYEAIHVIQEDLGLTGVAAQEASETFSGSSAAMKAAWTNLLADLSLGNDITDSFNTLAKSVGNFVFNNLLPMVGNIFAQIPSLLVTSINEGLPMLLEGFMNLIDNILTTLEGADFFTSGGEILNKLQNGIIAKLPELTARFGELITRVIALIQTKLPEFISKGGEFVINMANGLLQKLPTLITNLGTLLNNALSAIMQRYPEFASKGMDFVSKLARGVLNNLPAILSAIGRVIGSLLRTLASNMPQLMQKGFELISRLVSGIIRAIPQVLSAIGGMIVEMGKKFSPDTFLQAGRDMILGLARGIGGAVSSAVSAAVDAAKNILGSVKGFFGIASPSKVMANQVGKWIPAGIAEGIKNNMRPLDSAMNDLVSDTVLEANNGLNSALNSSNVNVEANSGNSALGAKLDAMIYLMQQYYPDMAKGADVDGNALVSAINKGLGVMAL